MTFQLTTSQSAVETRARDLPSRLELPSHGKNPWVPPSESSANGADQAISIAEAIHAYTVGGAHAMLAEDKFGSLEVGK